MLWRGGLYATCGVQQIQALRRIYMPKAKGQKEAQRCERAVQEWDSRIVICYICMYTVCFYTI